MAGGRIMYQFDHLVHFVKKPEQAVIDLKNEGLHVVKGGRHEMWGTYNALSYFGLSYIEFIGIDQEAVFQEAAKHPFTLHETYEKNRRQNGLTRTAIRTTSIEEDAKKFVQAGFLVNGPKAFSRTKPDGTVVSWKLLHIGKEDVKAPYPFFIEWDEVDEVREAQLTAQGTMAVHSAGDLKIAEITSILEQTGHLEEFTTLLGIPFGYTTDVENNAEVLWYELSGTHFKFYRPLGDGPVWEAFLEDGPGMYNVTFSGSEEDKIVHYEGANYIFGAK